LYVRNAEIDTAEQRGPGVRRSYNDSSDDFDLDMDQRTRGFGGRSGRVIILGDGTEVLTDSDEQDLEEKDEESAHNTSDDRSHREGTPGPEATKSEGSASHPEIKGIAASDAVPEKMDLSAAAAAVERKSS